MHAARGGPGRGGVRRRARRGGGAERWGGGRQCVRGSGCPGWLHHRVLVLVRARPRMPVLPSCALRMPRRSPSSVDGVRDELRAQGVHLRAQRERAGPQAKRVGWTDSPTWHQRAAGPPTASRLTERHSIRHEADEASGRQCNHMGWCDWAGCKPSCAGPWSSVCATANAQGGAAHLHQRGQACRVAKIVLKHALGEGGAGLWLHGPDGAVHAASQLLAEEGEGQAAKVAAAGKGEGSAAARGGGRAG